MENENEVRMSHQFLNTKKPHRHKTLWGFYYEKNELLFVIRTSGSRSVTGTLELFFN